MEFKDIYLKHQATFVYILIESQWNLKVTYLSKEQQRAAHINRITVEFKDNFRH